ncbi:oxidoreductase, short chain dehydrogenase/reductase family [Synechococcus sp. PCC 7335]|uniref:glucose 1-dehydrogenase n=1 Tax=Synechococcus sp. (strain ATCC 29403 / PCC 7335) TaxID=91464 RepID=UPI00017EB1A2|nr:glucose 1-dehydrogenase [Synechococcus sp. PCC 7335]EDX83523.1 oxidoreductase, short chain dehydrogenase/reductase family [Synechococcus sp. PCC 7335]
MSDMSRRKLVTAGAIGAVGLTAAVSAQSANANTQNPPAPQVVVSNGSRFTDKIVLITGATSGIGESTARAFAAEGATVHFCGRREELGEQVAQSIREAGGKATYQKADVRSESEIQMFVDTCVSQYGRIDIAFNNAGVESSPATIAERPLEEWMNVMTTNATGVFLSMKHEIPQMLNQGSGIIVNNASVSGHTGFATIAPYSASKHAVVSLTKVAALEYADKNIRVNAIAPGAVDTPMLRRAIAAWNTNAEAISQDYPIKRIVMPEEIARSVLFLCSDEATCIVGMDLDATGGYLA